MSSTDVTSPQGNLGAYSYGMYPGQRRIKRSFVEHGYIMCIASIRSDFMYFSIEPSHKLLRADKTPLTTPS